jgi:hypothetical protein
VGRAREQSAHWFHHNRIGQGSESWPRPVLAATAHLVGCTLLANEGGGGPAIGNHGRSPCMIHPRSICGCGLHHHHLADHMECPISKMEFQAHFGANSRFGKDEITSMAIGSFRAGRLQFSL